MGESGREGLGRLDFNSTQKEHLWPASIVTLALVILILGILSSEAPGGADSWGHIAKAEYLSDQMASEGWGAFFTSAWLPKWYLGDPFRTYYPPLSLLTLTPLIYLLGNAVAAYKIFMIGLCVLFAVLCYIFFNRQWGKWSAALGTVLALFAPYQLRTMFFEGNLPRALSMLSLPLIALATEEVLTTKGSRSKWIGVLVVGWAWALLSHSQQAYLYAIGFGIYLIIRLFLDVRIPLTPGLLWLVGLGIGVLVVAPWLVPAYSGAELSGVPYLPPEKVDLFSAPLSGIFPGFNAWDGRVLFGTGTIFLAILAMVARPEPRRNAWLVAGFLAVWLGLGPKGVLFSLLPLNQQLLPERFLNFSAFAFAAAGAGLLPMRSQTKWIRASVILALVVLDFIPSIPLLSGRAFPTDQSDMRALLPEAAPAGARVSLMTYPEPNAQEVYFAGQAGNLINGWALENTPHNQVLRRVLDVPSWSEPYLEHLFGVWNVNYAVVRAARETAENVRGTLEEAGFSTDGRTAHGYQIWEFQGVSSPVQVLPPSRMLALGDRLQPMFMAFPFAEEAEPTRFSDLPGDSLKDYEALALYRFEASDFELANSSRRLEKYLEDGGTLVVDLSGMEETFGRALDFLEVDVLRLSVLSDTRLDWHVDLGDLPEAMNLSEVAPGGWSGATYSGLDEVIASVEVNGKWYPFIGYRDIGDGRAWFVGFNLFYYAQLAGESGMVTALSDYFLAGEGVSTDLRFEPVPIEDWQEDSHGLRFKYDSDQPISEALISYTYSPRWRVSIDGEQVPFSTYERMLKVSLPEGNHDVRVDYDLFATNWPLYGLGLGGLGLLLFGGVYAGEWVIRKAGVFSKEMDENPDQVEHAPCPNCGFLLAEVNSPTSATYPFKAISCPICGMRVDDSGITEGETLTVESRKERLAIWLKSYKYDLETMDQGGGIGFQDYFLEGEIEEYLDQHYGEPEADH